MPWVRRRYRLSTEIEQPLLRISARRIDHRRREEKRQQRRQLYARTKPGTSARAGPRLRPCWVSQQAVAEALETMRQALPFHLRGIDSDNGSEFY